MLLLLFWQLPRRSTALVCTVCTAAYHHHKTVVRHTIAQPQPLDNGHPTQRPMQAQRQPKIPCHRTPNHPCTDAYNRNSGSFRNVNPAKTPL
mmetsp:Transcript_30918/g.52228  ORF Transcript_30918/g.52228 Transcript_30918/m.52228 type:complete len:92 (-) Transcript_30918:1749-2024(-)